MSEVTASLFVVANSTEFESEAALMTEISCWTADPLWF